MLDWFYFRCEGTAASAGRAHLRTKHAHVRGKPERNFTPRLPEQIEAGEKYEKSDEAKQSRHAISLRDALCG